MIQKTNACVDSGRSGSIQVQPADNTRLTGDALDLGRASGFVFILAFTFADSNPLLRIYASVMPPE
jgi:hypothetical protein